MNQISVIRRKIRNLSYREERVDIVKIKNICEPDFCICLNEWRVKIREEFLKKKESEKMLCFREHKKK